MFIVDGDPNAEDYQALIFEAGQSVWIADLKGNIDEVPNAFIEDVFIEDGQWCAMVHDELEDTRYILRHDKPSYTTVDVLTDAETFFKEYFFNRKDNQDD